MTRYKHIVGVDGIGREEPLSQAEEAERDAEEAAHAAASAAALAEAERLEGLAAAVAGDAKIAAIRSMGAAEFDAWLAANVTSASEASALLKSIARAILARGLLP